MSHASLVRAIRALDLSDEVMTAVEAVDRAGFVPIDHTFEAYEDRPVPLPGAQTTSQPSLIAQMIDAVDLRPEHKVLEIGTGFGYQTALIARIVQTVVSVERAPQLAASARVNLERNGITNVSVYVGDGWKGWPDEAPYDAIVVSAAAEELPAALVDQLTDEGRMVIPLQNPHSDDVTVISKRAGAAHVDGILTPARFVPLVRGDGS